MDECGLAGLEASELEQAVVGGTKGDRHARRLLDGQALGNRPAERLARGPELGVGSVEAHGDHPVAHGESSDRRAHLRDGAGTLVADDVRDARAMSPPSRLRVSPPSMLTASTRTSTSAGPTTGSGTSS